MTYVDRVGKKDNFFDNCSRFRHSPNFDRDDLNRNHMSSSKVSASARLPNYPQSQKDKMRLWLESNKDEVRQFNKVFHQNHQEFLDPTPKPDKKPFPSKFKERIIPSGYKWCKGPDGRWLRADELQIDHEFDDNPKAPAARIRCPSRNGFSSSPPKYPVQARIPPPHFMQSASARSPMKHPPPSYIHSQVNFQIPSMSDRPPVMEKPKGVNLENRKVKEPSSKVKDKIKIIEELQRNFKLNPPAPPTDLRPSRDTHVKKSEPWIYAQKRSRSNYGTLKDLLASALHRTISLMSSSVDEDGQTAKCSFPDKIKNLPTADKRKLFQDKQANVQEFPMTIKNYLDSVPVTEDFETEFTRRYSHLFEKNDFDPISLLNTSRKSKSLTSLAMKYHQNTTDIEFATDFNETEPTTPRQTEDVTTTDINGDHNQSYTVNENESHDPEEEVYAENYGYDSNQNGPDSFTVHNNYENYETGDYYSNQNDYYGTSTHYNDWNFENADELNNYYNEDNVIIEEMGPDTENTGFEGQETANQNATTVEAEYNYNTFETRTYRITENY